ncbi:major head protein [Pseudomonas phage vB_PpuP-Kurepalu-1]
MALDSYTVTRPNAKNLGSDNLELVIEEFTGMVEGTIQRRSVTEGWLPVRSVSGTATVTNFAVGESTLQQIIPGTIPDGVKSAFSKNSVTIDRTILARAVVPELDTFQTVFDSRKAIATEHGKKIAKMKDQSFLIMGAKAAGLATSPYGTPLPNFTGGSVETLSAAGDKGDAAKLYDAFGRLFTKMETKDVLPTDDDVVIFVRPDVFYTLLDAEQVINGNYVTAEGTSIEGHIFKAFGVPVVSTNNLPNWVEDGSAAGSVSNLMGSSYNGDFTKLVALAMSPKALLAGANIDLKTNAFFDDISKNYFVDAWLAYASTADRAEYAGAIYIP